MWNGDLATEDTLLVFDLHLQEFDAADEVSNIFICRTNPSSSEVIQRLGCWIMFDQVNEWLSSIELFAVLGNGLPVQAPLSID